MRELISPWFIFLLLRPGVALLFFSSIYFALVLSIWWCSSRVLCHNIIWLCAMTNFPQNYNVINIYNDLPDHELFWNFLFPPCIVLDYSGQEYQIFIRFSHHRSCKKISNIHTHFITKAPCFLWHIIGLYWRVSSLFNAWFKTDIMTVSSNYLLSEYNQLKVLACIMFIYDRNANVSYAYLTRYNQ